jgi:hypothetical protein
MANRVEQATMPISPNRRRNAKGVATIEVLVAVVIILLVGSIAIVSFGGTDRRAVRLEVAETALFLQETRMRAQELGRPIEIVVAGRDGLIDAGGRQHSFARGLTVSPQEARIVLQPTGQSDGLNLVFAKGDHSAGVTLDWLTGRVDLQ